MALIDTIRKALTEIEAAYERTLDIQVAEPDNEEIAGRAVALLKAHDQLWDLLVRTIRAEDPYTTEADIRYFEGIG